MSHQEKRRIFDEYAKSQGFKDFDDLVFTTVHTYNSDKTLEHVFAACDIVQEEQQRRIAEKEETISGDDFYFSGVPIDKIINHENLIK
ncbi:hypothetical protein LXM63_04395 [Chryseobacterium gleum]|uniref:hypothetical protein n=1 Tax=Chryseobacterium gleum TaxID=250 RepID=UPI001E3347F1|nr:hypothetical protein [Chryseobacterium gleum]MCE4064322.1 hypothetical protein [Chryseobacterium gleum]